MSLLSNPPTFGMQVTTKGHVSVGWENICCWNGREEVVAPEVGLQFLLVSLRLVLFVCRSHFLLAQVHPARK